MASAVAEPPVRLVKTIGDAVMLVSTEAEPMLSAALALIAAAEAEGEEFPWLRAGLACGPALPQSGDYYGRPVNLASRITGVARPGSVVVDRRQGGAGEGFAYTYIGERRLKGIDPVKLFRAGCAGELGDGCLRDRRTAAESRANAAARQGIPPPCRVRTGDSALRRHREASWILDGGARRGSTARLGDTAESPPLLEAD